jgi:release factor glutamine methyltransferase
MTVKDFLKTQNLEDIELLLMHVLGKSKEFLFLNPDFTLSQEQTVLLTDLVNRRKYGEPLAYLTGSKNFYGRNFKVTKDTLIPRPETEELINLVLKLNQNKPLKTILDVGTGSGCIAITLANELPEASIFASDISKEALEIAKENAKTHNAKITFFESDLLKNIQGHFDLIIANLPYVPEDVYRQNFEQLKSEPKLALVDNPGWPKTIELLKTAHLHLNLGGSILLEHDPAAMELIFAQAKQNGLASISIKKDYQGLNRYAVIS